MYDCVPAETDASYIYRKQTKRETDIQTEGEKHTHK